jgi:hypothetical protein
MAATLGDQRIRGRIPQAHDAVISTGSEAVAILRKGNTANDATVTAYNRQLIAALQDPKDSCHHEKQAEQPSGDHRPLQSTRHRHHPHRSRRGQ